MPTRLIASTNPTADGADRITLASLDPMLDLWNPALKGLTFSLLLTPTGTLRLKSSMKMLEELNSQSSLNKTKSIK